MPKAKSSNGFGLRDGPRSRTTLNDGNQMPVLGLGVYQTPPGGATREAVKYAISVGYRHVDTAALYRNEGDVGEAIRESGIPREELFVTTKLWNDDQGFDSAIRAFERSRKALDLAYVDLYLLHWPVSGKREDSWRALAQLLKEGRCRSIGVSNFTVAHLQQLLQHTEIAPAVNQVEFSPFLFQQDLLDYCHEKGIQLEAYAPLTKGKRLADPAVVRCATAHQKTPAQVLIRWGLQHRVVEIPKSVHPERIRENAGVFDFSLGEAEMKALDQLDEGYRTSWDPTEMA